ncbi:MAG TPA: dihydrofolate reductase family protein [Thermoleophilaceae bacterium]
MFEADPQRDLPFLGINMVASVDGKATLGGRVGALTSADDQAELHALRAEADAVLVGASTVRREGYGRLLPDELREDREARGLPREPLLCIASASLRIDPDVDALRETGPRPLLVLTSADGRLPGDPAEVEYLQGHATDGRLEFAPLLRRLKAEHGVGKVVCEGGPTLNGTLFAEGLVDAVFLSVSPWIAGAGESLTIVAGAPLREPVRLRLGSAAEVNGLALLRYQVER